jgi:hypothetical protein
MSMETGSRLGPYEIVDKLGAGGMGEVWLAEDSRLGRRVAIKVLPEAFAGDPERLARFEQEARAAAALNHPNIAAVHDVGNESGTHFMVQEYLTGHSLRSTIEAGPLSLKKTLALATEIAEALRAAHKAGIVHRDLKPDNVFVTEDGHAKVLDFGLAKLTEMTGPAGDMSMSPTVLGTMAGTVMGTAGYMAPEQIEGGAVDGRADLFAFGCVLQEMLTGKRAFPGKSMLDTLHRIAHGEPEAIERPGESVPSALQSILAKCLTRDRELRYQHADDLRVDLQRLAADVEAGRVEPAVAAVAVGSRAAGPPMWAVAAVSLLAAAAAFYFGMRTAPAGEPPEVVRFEIEPPPGSVLRHLGFQPGLWLNPATRQVLYLAISSESELRSYSRVIDSVDPVPLPLPLVTGAVSPDGRWMVGATVGATTRSMDQLVRVSLVDGSVRTLQAESARRLPSIGWLSNDRFVLDQGTSFSSMSIDGGATTPLPALPEELAGARVGHPVALPGGRHLLFTSWAREAFDDQGLFEGLGEIRIAIAAMDLASGATRILVPDARQPQYVEPGFLVFAQGSELRAARIDPATGTLTSELVTVLRDVRGDGPANYAVTPGGDLAYQPAMEMVAERALVWVDQQGVEEALPLPLGNYGRPRISDDGRFVAVDDENDGDIWIWDLQRRVSVRLTTDPATDHSPIWSPDGTQVYFWSNREPSGLYRKAASGVGSAELAVPSSNQLRPYRFLADGSAIVSATMQNDILLASLDGDPAVTPILATDFATSRPELSPNGRWLAYRGNETGTFQIYVRPFPNVEDDRIAITADGGITPIWSRDGQTIYYMLGGDMYAVDVTPGERFDAGRPRLVFSGPYENLAAGGRRFDIDPASGRFLLVKDVREAAGESGRIVVVLNWVRELERLLPEQ